MNSEEGMSLAKMAVTVLLVVLVIGAVVAIVYAAYAWYTKGTDKLTDQVVSIDKSSFSQYDNAQVSGSDVLSALKTYRESDIAIIICNAQNQTNSGKFEFNMDAASVTGYNYCALVAKDGDGDGEAAAGDDATGETAETVTVTNTEGIWEVPGLAWGEDKVTLTRNTNFSPTTTNGNSARFVKQSANWYANLIYDASTDDVCGILFRQMN